MQFLSFFMQFIREISNENDFFDILYLFYKKSLKKQIKGHFLYVQRKFKRKGKKFIFLLFFISSFLYMQNKNFTPSQTLINRGFQEDCKK